MITEIEIANVRIFEGEGWRFLLPPLTVFCGTNSSGKSTILKLLLLLRQSIGIRETAAVAQDRLRLVGSQIDFGDYTSVVSHNETRRDITIGVTISDKIHSGYAQLFRTVAIPGANLGEIHESGMEDYTLRSLFTFGILKAKRKKQTTRDETMEPAPLPPFPGLKRSQHELTIDGKVLLRWEVRLDAPPVGPERPSSYKMLIPQALFERTGGFTYMDIEHPAAEEFVTVDVVLRGLLPDNLVAKERIGDQQPTPSNRWRVFPMPPYIETLLDDLKGALASIHYLGPLRSPAKRYYVAGLDSSPSLDAAGEFLPYILRDRQHYEVLDCGPLQRRGEDRVSLRQALNEWLYYFRTGELAQSPVPEEVKVEVTGDVLVEFRLRNTGGLESHGLADSGFGYSQILPILVRGLLAHRGSTLVVEQPELHLNPAIQVRLAEFFIAMVRSGKQVLLETHSEHIVNSIRVITAEDQSKGLHNKCGVYFLQAEAKRPVVHSLSIQENGTVPEWPREFFGEAASLAGRLLRAQGNRRGA